MNDKSVSDPASGNGPRGGKPPRVTWRKHLYISACVVPLLFCLSWLFAGQNRSNYSHNIQSIKKSLIDSNSRFLFKGGVVSIGGSTIHKLDQETALRVAEALHGAATRSDIPANYLSAHIFHESTGDPRAEFRNLKQWSAAKNDRERFASADHGLAQISGRNLLKMFPNQPPDSLKSKAEDIDFAVSFLVDTISDDLRWAAEQDIDSLTNNHNMESQKRIDSRVVIRAKNRFWLAALAYNRGRPGAIEALVNPRACRHADFIIDAWKHIDSINGTDRSSGVSAPDFPPEEADDPRILAIVDDGPRVEALQNLLNVRLESSPKLKADGRFGPATRVALREFQRNHNLGSSGVTDSATWGKLLAPDGVKPDTPKLLTMGDQGQEVESLQELLNNLGRDSHPLLTVDGRFGAATRDALLDFQKSHQLQQTGAADFSTFNLILNIVNKLNDKNL